MSFSERVTDLTEEELDALTAAASWYASYTARDIAAESDDRSAYAVEARDSYLSLLRGLRKLGIMLAVPDALLERNRRAA
jgi:hypothetical protein